MNIGLIGAGTMGRTMAEKILGAGHKLYVYDVFIPALSKPELSGAEVCQTPAEVSEKAEIIIISLPGPLQIEAAVTGREGLLSVPCTGKVIIDTCTSDPDCTKRMAEASEGRGADYLDAPILGRPATVGKWALPVGGQKEVFDRCHGFLEVFAANVLYIGESGSGHKLKLLNQMMFGAINAMTAEMMAISDKIGIKPDLLYKTIVASEAGTVSNLFRELGGRIAEERYEDPTFTVDLLIKDVKLGVEMAKQHGAPPVMGRTVELINEMASAQGYGSEDTSIMWKSMKPIWNKAD